MFFGEWLIYAVLALVCWGLVNVLDTFFVEEKIYKNASEGMIVSSLFKIVGVVLIGGIFFREVLNVDLNNALLAMLGGILLSASFWFYLKAAFLYNDLSLVQIFWILYIPLVSFLGWWMIDERIGVESYIGMGIILAGGIFISFSRKSLNVKLGKFFLINIPMIIIYALSQITMKYTEEIGQIDFWGSFPYVCLGQVIFGVVLLAFRWKSVDEKKLFSRVTSGNWKMFASSEIIELIGLFFMMLSIAKTPAIAFHAVTEAFMPLTVIAMTGIAGIIMKMLGKSKSLSEVYANNQIAGIWSKIGATVIMAVGIYLMA